MSIINELLDEAGIDLSGDLKRRVLRGLGDALNGNLSVKAAAMLGHNFCKSIDASLDNDVPLTLEQKQEVTDVFVQRLIQALGTIEAALAMHAQKQYAVVQAKASGDAAAIKAARKARNESTDLVEDAFESLARIANGDSPLIQ